MEMKGFGSLIVQMTDQIPRPSGETASETASSNTLLRPTWPVSRGWGLTLIGALCTRIVIDSHKFITDWGHKGTLVFFDPLMHP